MSAIESVSVAIEVLFENMRDPDAGIIRLGIRDNAKTRQAIATLINCTGSIIAEIEQLRQERDGLRDTNHALAEKLDELCRVRNERDGLLADAARYRWLREKVKNLEFVIAFEGAWGLRSWSGDDPDRAIDNAMAKEQGE